LDLFQVAVGKVEYEEADYNSSDRREPVMSAEKEDIDSVEDIPYTPPNEDQADDNREVVSEIADEVPPRLGLVRAVMTLVHTE